MLTRLQRIKLSLQRAFKMPDHALASGYAAACRERGSLDGVRIPNDGLW